MALPQTQTIHAFAYRDGALAPVDIPVSSEYAVLLSINGNPFVSIACSGSDFRELAMGHLLSEGIITAADEVVSLDIDEDALTIDALTVQSDEMIERLFRVRSIASGCGQGTAAGAVEGLAAIAGIPRIAAKAVTESMREFLRLSETHTLTHGVHSAALYSTKGERLVFYEEIGRHNAVDKILGRALIDRADLSRCMLLSTGRLSSEIVFKAVRASLPVLVSRAAPTARAIEIARRFNVMLIGGVRASSFYLYHGSEAVQC